MGRGYYLFVAAVNRSGVLRLGRAIGFNQTRRIAAKAWRGEASRGGNGPIRAGPHSRIAQRTRSTRERTSSCVHGVGEVALDRGDRPSFSPMTLVVHPRRPAR